MITIKIPTEEEIKNALLKNPEKYAKIAAKTDEEIDKIIEEVKKQQHDQSQ